MGWPPCMVEGCDGWPSIGCTGVCAGCITDPVKVVKVAARIFNNSVKDNTSNSNRACLLSFLGCEPDGSLLLRVAELMKSNGYSIDIAAEKVREEYWAKQAR